MHQKHSKLWIDVSWWCCFCPSLVLAWPIAVASSLVSCLQSPPKSIPRIVAKVIFQHRKLILKPSSDPRAKIQPDSGVWPIKPSIIWHLCPCAMLYAQPRMPCLTLTACKTTHLLRLNLSLISSDLLLPLQASFSLLPVEHSVLAFMMALNCIMLSMLARHAFLLDNLVYIDHERKVGFKDYRE